VEGRTDHRWPGRSVRRDLGGQLNSSRRSERFRKSFRCPRKERRAAADKPKKQSTKDAASDDADEKPASKPDKSHAKVTDIHKATR